MCFAFLFIYQEEHLEEQIGKLKQDMDRERERCRQLESEIESKVADYANSGFKLWYLIPFVGEMSMKNEVFFYIFKGVFFPITEQRKIG